MSAVLQVSYLLAMPLLALWLCAHSRACGWLGPVVFAYGFGFLLPFLPLETLPVLTRQVRDLALPLAIPLLLFTLDVRSWLRDARPAVLSFLLCIGALATMVVLTHALLADQVTHAAEVAGMLSALYSGGAPNMAVVHHALEAPPELYLQVNTVDVLSGAVYFLFLVSLAGPVYGRFLRVVRPAENPLDGGISVMRWRDLPLAAGMAVLIVAVSAGSTVLLTGHTAVAPIMLGITSLAIAASFWPRLRAIRSSDPAGSYLVLVFCCALGSQVDLGQISSGLAGIAIMLLTVLMGTILLHLWLARLCGIDRDTAIITQTAALYGPPFVPPVAGALGNPALLLSGLTTGLAGYALGNYLGLAMASILR